MKIKFVSQFDSKRGKGYEVEIDKIRNDVGYGIFQAESLSTSQALSTPT